MKNSNEQREYKAASRGLAIGIAILVILGIILIGGELTGTLDATKPLF